MQCTRTAVHQQFPTRNSCSLFLVIDMDSMHSYSISGIKKIHTTEPTEQFCAVLYSLNPRLLCYSISLTWRACGAALGLALIFFVCLFVLNK